MITNSRHNKIMNTNEYIIYPKIQAIEPTENMKNQEIINKRHRIQGGIMFIGGLVFAAVITAATQVLRIILIMMQMIYLTKKRKRVMVKN
jgi:hypothetical protein